MSPLNIVEKLEKLFKGVKFVTIATCDLYNNPNASPKYLLKVINKDLYIVDYLMGKTWDNLKVNPKVSLSAIDTFALLGYRLNGIAEIIPEGSKAYEELKAELKKKALSSSVERILEAVRHGKKHQNFEVNFPERVGIFRVNVKELTEIEPTGKMTKTRK